MDTRVTAAASVLVVALAAGCSVDGAWTLSSAAPAAAVAGQSIPITISGDGFSADAQFSLDDKANSFVLPTYRAWLGDAALESVEWVDPSTLSAVLPPTLTAGVYSLHVEGPRGQRATLEDAFTVTASPGPCAGVTCGQHGTCIESDGVASCVCAPGWALPSCDSCDTGYLPSGSECVLPTLCAADSCNFHGQCDDSGGLVSCSCDVGWAGPTCTSCDAGYTLVGGDCVVDPGAPSPPDSVVLTDPTPVAGQQADVYSNDLVVSLAVQPSPSADAYCATVDEPTTSPLGAAACWVSTPPPTVTLAGEGLHQVTVWTRNTLGTVSATGTTGSIIVDQTQPSLTFTTPADGFQTSATTVAASGTVNDANGLLAFTVNGTCASPECAFGGGDWTYDPLLLTSVGLNVFALEAIDAAGNTRQLSHSIERTGGTVQPTDVLGGVGNTTPVPTNNAGPLCLAFGEFGGPVASGTPDGMLDVLLGYFGESVESVQAWRRAASDFAAGDFVGPDTFGIDAQNVRSLSVGPWIDGDFTSAFARTDEHQFDGVYQRLNGTWVNIAADAFYPADNQLLVGDNNANSFALTFIDYDNDGDLDLYRVTGAQAGSKLTDELLTNVGSTPEGVWTYAKIGTGPSAAEKQGVRGHGIAVADFDGNGLDDIFVSDYGAALYLNQTTQDDTPSFTIYPFDFNATDAFGESRQLQGPMAFDYDNDGDLDLYVPAYGSDPCRLYRNELVETGAFDLTDMTDVTLALQAAAYTTVNATGAYAGDVDNDGDLDLYVTSHATAADGGAHLLRNDLVMPDGSLAATSPSFTEATADALKLQGYDTYGAAWIDYEGDGDLDLIVAAAHGGGGDVNGMHVFRNTYYEQGGTGRHYRVKVRVDGKANPLGARVVVTYGGHTQVQQYMPVTGFGSMASPVLHFGVGAAATVSVEVTARGLSYTESDIATSDDGTVDIIDL